MISIWFSNEGLFVKDFWEYGYVHWMTCRAKGRLKCSAWWLCGYCSYLVLRNLMWDPNHAVTETWINEPNPTPPVPMVSRPEAFVHLLNKMKLLFQACQARWVSCFSISYRWGGKRQAIGSLLTDNFYYFQTKDHRKNISLVAVLIFCLEWFWTAVKFLTLFL